MEISFADLHLEYGAFRTERLNDGRKQAEPTSQGVLGKGGGSAYVLPKNVHIETIESSIC
jgi:hypothetical protein